MGPGDWLSTAPKVHSPTVGATMSIDPTIALIQTWAPAQAETVNAVSPGYPGQVLTLILVGGSTSYAITLGTYFSEASVINTGNAGDTTLEFISTGIAWVPCGSSIGVGAGNSGLVISKRVLFTENATNTVHTGTVTLPAGAWLHSIQVTNQALWTGGTATMIVGDTADPDGYFTTTDLKATDLLVGEVLDSAEPSNWGGVNGAYLVAATGRRGPTTNNFGMYYAAGSNIIGVVTVGTPATTVGRTLMTVNYSVGQALSAVATGP